MEASLQKTDLWNDVVSSVEQRLNKHIVDSWFRPVHFEGNDAVERTLHLRAGQVTKDWVTLYYSELLAKTLEDLGYPDHKIVWSIDESETEDDRFGETTDDDFNSRAAGAAPAAAGEREPSSDLARSCLPLTATRGKSDDKPHWPRSTGVTFSSTRDWRTRTGPQSWTSN